MSIFLVCEEKPGEASRDFCPANDEDRSPGQTWEGAHPLFARANRGIRAVVKVIPLFDGIWRDDTNSAYQEQGYILVERDNCVFSSDARQCSAVMLAWVEQSSEVCGDAGPVELKVKEFFLSLVERIRQRLSCKAQCQQMSHVKLASFQGRRGLLHRSPCLTTRALFYCSSTQNILQVYIYIYIYM